MKQSDKAARRLESTNNHFSVLTAVNIASLTVLTTIGVNYMIDNIKEKKDSVRGTRHPLSTCGESSISY